MQKAKKTNGKLLMLASIILCILLFLQPLTGDILHAIFGVLLLILILVHIGRNRKKIKYKKKSVQVVDWMIIIALIILIVSGVLLHPMRGLLALKIAHRLSAVIFLITLIIHGVQNRKKLSQF